MSIFAFIIGMTLPTLSGWLLLRCIEGHHLVLMRIERWILGCILGLPYSMFIVFLAHVFAGLPLTRIGFGAALSAPLIVLLAIFFRRKLPWKAHAIHGVQSAPLSRRAKFLWGMLIGWIVLRTVITGTTFLLLTPTFLDDALDNWNLRGKVFFETKQLTLVMPNEDPVLSPRDVSSYPPALPLMKTWLATINGAWSDPLINSIHIVWYIAALFLVYFALRRYVARGWALLGSYLLGSLPLFLMHGTNPYADASMATHVFAAMSLLFHAIRTTDSAHRWTFVKLAALATAILPFVKNEGLLVYLPPLLLILLWFVWRERRTLPALKTVAWWGANLLLVIGPWLFFKWSRGLTFGNAKPFTSLGIGWQENVLLAITVNTFFEGNWLLLFPIFFGLIIWKWRAAFGRFAPLTIFFLIVYLGQVCLYLFTSLSTEALRQTGYARGLIHLVPVVVFLTVLLLEEVSPPFIAALRRSK